MKYSRLFFLLFAVNLTSQGSSYQNSRTECNSFSPSCPHKLEDFIDLHVELLSSHSLQLTITNKTDKNIELHSNGVTIRSLGDSSYLIISGRKVEIELPAVIKLPPKQASSITINLRTKINTRAKVVINFAAVITDNILHQNFNYRIVKHI